MDKRWHSSLFSNLRRSHKTLLRAQCLLSLRMKRSSRMCLPTPNTAINHQLPNNLATPSITPRERTSHITPFPKCNSQHLMVKTPKYGLITVRTISPYTLFQRDFGSLQHLCIYKAMQLCGGRHTNRITETSHGQTSA